MGRLQPLVLLIVALGLVILFGGGFSAVDYEISLYLAAGHARGFLYIGFCFCASTRFRH